MVESDPQAPTPSAPPTDPLIGKELHGRFRILERLGAGGMGTVYKAIQSPLDRVVALKVLNSDYGAGRDPGFQRRFFLEASVTSKLKHPNTIHVIDYGKTDEGIFYIAMEFLEGITLSQLIQKHGPLPWHRVLHLSQQICRSLREAHKSGVVHRDLKPANVMILHEETDHDLVKVLDFGLVKSFLPDKPLDETELTQAGVFLGSPQYVAPEQARNQADPRSDIYSLGVMMYQMLMGRPPFLAAQSIDVIIQHLNEKPTPFAQLKPDIQVPEAVEGLVLRCLEKKPEARFQSMEELLEAIRQAAGGLSGVYTGIFTGVTPAPISPGSSLWPRPPSQPAMPVQVVPPSSESPTTALRPGRAIAPRRRWLVPAIVGAAIILVAAVAVVVHARATPAPIAPAPVPVPVPVVTTPAEPHVEPPASAPADSTSSPVQFVIESDPPGAKVSVDGAAIGPTPITFTRPAGADGTAKAALTFKLDGYEEVSVATGGPGPQIHLTQKLRRRAAKVKQHSAGYKEDPYQ
jgi:serine/threonine protein kinase